MKVLMTTQPGLGHLHPMLPLARALQEAGHTVAFACAAAFVPEVTTAGFEAFAAGIDWLESRVEEAFPEARALDADARSQLISDIFLDDAAHQMAHDLLPLCREWQPDVIVRDHFEYGGCVAAEVLALPHAAVGIEFFIPEYLSRLEMESRLAYLRSAYGLPPYPAQEMLSRYLHFSYIAPCYQFPNFPVPVTAHPMRPVFFEATEPVALPAWVAELPERPTVYVTLGTVFNRAVEIFTPILEGLKSLPLNVIVTVGRTLDPEALGPQPEHIRVERYISQAALLPHCDAVITHGGFSTTLAALAQGLPVVVTPLSAHHPLHARRCLDLGVGRVLLRRPGLFPEHFQAEEAPLLTADNVRAAVQAILEEVQYREAAQRLAAEIRALPGPEVAVRLLEHLARERQPLIASSSVRSVSHG